MAEALAARQHDRAHARCIGFAGARAPNSGGSMVRETRRRLERLSLHAVRGRLTRARARCLTAPAASAEGWRSRRGAVRGAPNSGVPRTQVSAPACGRGLIVRGAATKHLGWMSS